MSRVIDRSRLKTNGDLLVLLNQAGNEDLQKVIRPLMQKNRCGPWEDLTVSTVEKLCRQIGDIASARGTQLIFDARIGIDLNKTFFKLPSQISDFIPILFEALTAEEEALKFLLELTVFV